MLSCEIYSSIYTFSMFVMVSTSVHERVPDYHTKKSLVLNFDCLEQVGQILWDAWKFTWDDWIHRNHCGTSPLTFSHTVSPQTTRLPSLYPSPFLLSRSLYSLPLCHTLEKTSVSPRPIAESLEILVSLFCLLCDWTPLVETLPVSNWTG